MILYQNICLETLVEAGKYFKWKRPESCKRCGSKLWGHGFVSGYLVAVAVLLYYKRYRCPVCRLVITLKPAGYWRYFRSSINEIFRVLWAKFKNHIWQCPRQRGGHWLSRFRHYIHIGGYVRDDPIMILEQAHEAGVCFLVK